MAIQAYSDRGQLKKNPLLGTSLNVDRKQRKQKRSFKTLYNEAESGVGTGGTQQDMTRTLVKRDKDKSRVNLSRLNDLSSQSADMA